MKTIAISKPGRATTVAILATVGGRDESDNVKGISHFIEHLCFKGSKKYNQNEIVSYIENCGGEINAFTDLEETCYWAKVPNKYAKKTADILTDMATNPLFPLKEIDSERQVIFQEMKRGYDSPARYIEDLFFEKYFSPLSRLHISVIGTQKSMNNIGIKELRQFHQDHYKDLIKVIIGDVENTYCPDTPKGDTVCEEPLLITSKQYTEYRTGIRQAQVVIGNFFYDINGIDDVFKLELLNSIFNSLSGRLFKNVRDKYGLCYSICFGGEKFWDGLNMWCVQIGCEKKKIEFAKEAILKELTRPFTKEEIELGVRQFIGSTDLQFEDTKEIAMDIVKSISRGLKWQSSLWDYEKLIKIAAKDIVEFQEKMDFRKNLTVSIEPK